MVFARTTCGFVCRQGVGLPESSRCCLDSDSWSLSLLPRRELLWTTRQGPASRP